MTHPTKSGSRPDAWAVGLLIMSCTLAAVALALVSASFLPI